MTDEQATGKTILLVVRHPDERALIEELLAWRGHNVTAVESGRDCLALLKGDGTTVDMVVLATLVDLPDLEGFELCRRIRAEQGTQTPIVVLTAAASAENRARAADLGVFAFISKPFELNSFIETIDQGLTRRPADPQ